LLRPSPPAPPLPSKAPTTCTECISACECVVCKCREFSQPAFANTPFCPPGGGREACLTLCFDLVPMPRGRPADATPTARVLRPALLPLPWVRDVVLEPRPGLPRLRVYCPCSEDRAQVEWWLAEGVARLARFGYPAQPSGPMCRRTVLQLEGLSCTSCIRGVEGVLRAASARVASPPLLHSTVSLQVAILYHDPAFPVQLVVEGIQDLGLDARLQHSGLAQCILPTAGEGVPESVAAPPPPPRAGEPDAPVETASMVEVTINIQGMTCSMCTLAITQRLQGTPGIATVGIDLLSNQVG
jgi:copper chaperone CopZ